MTHAASPPGRPGRGGRAVSYDVRIWKIRTYDGARGRSFGVRWTVAGKGHSKNFGTYALADSFRAELLTAARQGQPFDAATGLPFSLLSQQEPERSWWEHACAFIDMKWPRAAPRSRQSIADALATVTPALLVAGSGRPPAAALREAMYGWAFNTGRRAGGGPPDHLTHTVAWLARHSLPLAALAAPRVARAALDTLATKLDGTPASPTTTARKRAVLFTALEYAVELGHLEVNPLTRVSWTAPKLAETVDRRAVVNHDQARALLAAVAAHGDTGRHLVALNRPGFARGWGSGHLAPLGDGGLFRSSLVCISRPASAQVRRPLAILATEF